MRAFRLLLILPFQQCKINQQLIGCNENINVSSGKRRAQSALMITTLKVFMLNVNLQIMGITESLYVWPNFEIFGD